jgi:hypothetical protein
MEEVAALVTAADSVGVRRYCMIGMVPYLALRGVVCRYVGTS